ncbi:FecR domain-containing protein [Bradyrhizobium sp. SSUT18]|uniref:Ig-like domain-containing protein n=1 Tax=Bradyrhizobium sp. SSUT18 TaxID=3040602 RepID=UPI00244B4B5D|nr:FecR domain-containing protein [Bradyrhizobium sp. SSUT18]MDH2402709.1 FecR domain-containing protein [Bradyrhizobium sp. SSUT18]
MDGEGSHSPADAHVDSFTAKPIIAKAHGHVPEGAFVVPDPNLIFNGEFKRAGSDLVLSHDCHEFVVHDYFRGEKRAALSSPDGAHLTGDIVNALTGHVQYAQAASGIAAAQVIGHVTKLSGSATAIRNGVSVILNNGDNVEKGDVVSTGGDSTLGITFIDGTVFGLSSNARMVLNEMVYDPNGSNNSSLLSLVAGTITFVAGETAKHGDMKIDTPVATMGIRGTAVLSQIHFVVPAGGGDPQPEASFQVLVEPNGTTGSYILFDKVTLLPIATVNQAGQMIQISGGNVSISNALMSPDIQKLITDVFTLKFTDNNSNTKLTTNFTDSITQNGNIVVIKTDTGATATATFTNLNPPGSQGDGHDPATSTRIPGPPDARSLDLNGNVKTAFALTEHANATGDRADATGDTVGPDTIIFRITFVDQNLGDHPTVSVNLADAPNYVYMDADHHDVTGSLSALQKQDIAATQTQISVAAAAGNNNNGSADLTYTIPDHVFDFLAAGETLTLTYKVRINNNFAVNPESTYIPISITITGTNDKPVITTSVPIIIFEGGTSVPGGPLTSDVPTTGTLSFDDVDLTDKHTVSVALTSATLPDGTVPPGPLAAFQSAMSVAIAAGADSTGDGTGTINWSLADLPVYLADFIPKGEVLTLVYTVTVTDSQGATSQRTITVTITGTDAAAVVWIATDKAGAPSGGFWKDAANWETGTVPTIDDDVIVITDQLHGLTPSYPVTIDTAAYAKSITMNDFGGPPPKVINQSTLTVAGALNMSADSIFTNALSGTVFVGGKAEILDTALLTNAGHLILEGGGDFASGTTITNSGVLELFGGTLKTLAGIHNAGGTLKADIGTTLIVDAATVDGGTVTILGTLDLDGTSVLENGTLNNSGAVNVNGTAEFAHETVANASSGTIKVLANGWLTIDQGSSVANNGAVTIDASGKLTVNGATISGAGTVTDNGEIDLAGNAVLSGGVLKNNTAFNVSGAGNALDGETVTNAGTIEVLAGGALAIDQGSTVDNTGNVTVDATGKLTVNGATISGAGTVTDNGQIDLTGSAVLTGGILKNNATLSASGAGNALDNETITNSSTGTIEVFSGGALTIDLGSSVANAGNVTVDNNGKLTVNGATISGAGTVTDNGEIDLTGNAVLTGGILKNNGAFKVSGAGNALDNETITNSSTGTIEVLANGALTIDQGSSVDNTGNVKVDATGKLTVNGAAISGAGTVTDNSEIDLTGNAVLSNGILKNNAAFKVSGAGNALDGESVTNAGTIEVLANGTLAIALGSTVDNSSGNVTVDGNAALMLDDATISGGAVKGAGTIHVTGASKIDDGATVSISTITADAALTLDGVTVSGTDITDKSSIALANTVELKDGATIQGASAVSKGAITNNGTLEIAGAATLLNDVVINTGHIIKIDDGQTLTLSGTEISGGTINNYSGALGGTIDVTGDSTIDGNATLNKGAITVESGYTLRFGDATVAGTAIANHGAVKVDASKTLALNGASLTGGALTVSGTLDSTGTTKVTNASIANNGLIEALGGLLTLAATTSASIANAGTLQAKGAELDVDHQAVTNTGTLAAINDGTLKLIGMTVTNTNGTVSVESGSTLDLQGATIDGGTVTIAGMLESTGTSAIDNADITNTGTISVTSGTLTIDPATVHAITNHGLIQVSGGELDISGEDISNTADIKAINYGTLKLANVTVSNSITGAITVDGTSKLYLTDVSINGGGLGNAGNLYSVSGNNTVTGGVTNTGAIEVQAGTLNLSGGLSGVGSLIIDDGATLELAGATAQTVTFAGGADTLQLDKVAGQSFTGTIAGQSTKGGTFTITGAADITSASGDALDFTASGGAPATPANIILTPAGALTGAVNGVVVTQDGTGDISLTATGDIKGLAGNGITLRDSATGSGNITVNNATGTATGTGANSIGILVENLNAANDGDISITQLVGVAGGAYGIDAVTQGGGDIAIHAGGTITGSSVYGIRARSYGAGSETVTTDAGSVINSGSSGIVAVNRAASLDSASGSSITVNGYGTISSGSSLNQSGNPPAGIQAGYNGATTGSSANTNVNGSVVVNNHANITAAAGYGIHAYNYGNGDVTVNDAAGTAIVGAEEGIRAQALSGGTGDISITLGASASVTGTTSYGILAYSIDAGDISVTLANGDSITSDSSGIVAVNYATTIASGLHSTIFVEAHGTIHSGSTLNNDGGIPGGIIAGYKPGGNGAFSNAVNGDVTVTSDATIIADAGYGIEAFTWGAGDITVTAGAGSSVTATAGTAIGAFDHGGGNVSVTNNGSATGTVGLAALASGDGDITIDNHGNITSTSLAGISVTQSEAGATGSTHITNTGSIVAPSAHAAIFIQENATGCATIDNSGTIGPATVTSTTYAIVETGGAITINNSGHINGNISVATATFNNEAGGIWTVSGSGVFGNASSIVNHGDIDLHGASISGTGLSIQNYSDIDSWGTASISGTIANTGTIEVHNGALTLFGSLSGSGSVTVDAGALLKVEDAVSQTVTLAGDGARLQIDTSTFGGSIAELSAGDKIDLSSIVYDDGTSATYNAATGELVVSDAYHHTITLQLTGADYSGAHFAGSSDGHGGTLITFDATDAAPAFTAAGATLTATVPELENTTGSSTLDPTPTAATGSIDFKDVDLTDRPTATITGQTVTWTGADHTTNLSGFLTTDEINALDHALTLQQTGNKNNGAVGWTYSIADKALDFLGADETVKVMSTITLDDGHNKTDTAQVTVTITGANDAPALNVDQACITQVGDQVTVHGLSLADPDTNDAFTIAATAASCASVTPSTGSGSLADINSALQALTYTEASSGGPATDKIAVTVTDAHGASDKVNLIFHLTETAVSLTGTTDKDVFFGTGYQDQFVFAANSNHDTIVNFTSGTDHIDLSFVGASNVSDWMAQHVTASGADTLITIDTADTILLKGVSSVQASDFILHVT